MSKQMFTKIGAFSSLLALFLSIKSYSKEDNINLSSSKPNIVILSKDSITKKDIYQINIPNDNEENKQFYISEINDEIFKRIEGKSFNENCTLERGDLRYLHILYKDLNGKSHEGEMIVNYHISDVVLNIFKKLYEEGYPIEKIRLIDEYDANDMKSMEDNNSSCFNFRFISHTKRVSKHGLGLAIDINPLYNPYIKEADGKTILEPSSGAPYVDRNKNFSYKIDNNDLCYKLFTENGFEWGGDWEDRKDYQHFEIPTSLVNEWYPDKT